MSSLPKEWIYVIPDEKDNYILYAPLHREAFRITPEAAENLVPVLNGEVLNNQFQDEIRNLLVEKKLLLLPRWISDHSLQPKSEKDNKIFLSITNKCNLRCVYCYAAAGVSHTSLTYNTAKEVLDFQLENILATQGNTIAVTFHGGGEALVELNLLKKIVAYIQTLAQKYKLKAVLNCVTNATLVTEDVAEWLSENFSHLTVSFDGVSEIQDIQRPKASNSGSFDDVMSGIRNLKNKHIKFDIRATVTDLGVRKMKDFVLFVKENIFQDGGYLHFEPVSLAGRAKGANQFSTDPEEFLSNYLAARKSGQQVGIKVGCSMDTFGSAKEHFCGASTATIQCYTPDGMLSACPRVTKGTDDGAPTLFYGKVKDGKVKIFPERQKKIVAIGSSYINKCSSCFARWNCQGGCMMSRYDGGENLNHTCFVTRQLLMLDLIQALDKANEITQEVQYG